MKDKVVLDWMYSEYIPNEDGSVWQDGHKPDEYELESVYEEIKLFFDSVGRFPADSDELIDWIDEEQILEMLLEEDENGTAYG